MTRKEEIEKKAKIRANQYSHPVEWYDCYRHWIEGAEWADTNPNEQAIAKYLYEKKGYPIDLNGNIPSFEDTMKDVEKYDNYKKKQFIEKACEFLKSYRQDTCDGTGYIAGVVNDKTIEDFKNYMKGDNYEAT